MKKTHYTFWNLQSAFTPDLIYSAGLANQPETKRQLFFYRVTAKCQITHLHACKHTSAETSAWTDLLQFAFTNAAIIVSFKSMPHSSSRTGGSSGSPRVWGVLLWSHNRLTQIVQIFPTEACLVCHKTRPMQHSNTRMLEDQSATAIQ